MGKMGTLYIDKDSFFHRMDGSIKFLLFITWYIVVFMFMDLRVFGILTILGALMLCMSKIPYKNIKHLLWIMIGFNIMNSIFILLITPTYGTSLLGSNTGVLNIGYATINRETIIYVLTLALKYANLLPITLIFIFTTHPSKFGSSLNKIGVPYKVAYAINIAFRYIPDIQEEFKTIVNAQQARGLSFKKGEASLTQRIKNVASIGLPLVVSSLHRIEVVTNAMELRSFGKHKERTWYNGTSFKKDDYVTLAICVVFLIASLWMKTKFFSGLWYPFK